MGKNNRKTEASFQILLYLLISLAFFLRIYRLDAQSIWRDEGVSIHLAASDFPTILADRAGNVHPPLYFILLSLWTKVAGLSVFSVRFFSLIFSVLLVPLTYKVSLQWFGIPTALVTTGLVTFSPLYIVYAQETRVYSMLPLLYLLMMHSLDQLARGRDWGWAQWLGLAGLEVLSLYLHYFSLIAVVYLNLVLFVLWLKRQPVHLRFWLGSQGLTALFCVPWAWIVLKYWWTEGPPRTYFGDLAPPSGAMRLPEVLAQTWYFHIGGFDFRGHPWFPALSLSMAILLALSLWVGRRSPHRQQLAITLLHWICPLCIVFLIWWWKPMISPRYIIMFTPLFFHILGHLLATTGDLGKLARLSRAGLALTVMATFSVGLRMAYFAHSKDDLRGLSDRLSSAVTTEDAVLIHPLEYGIEYYYKGDAPLLKIDPDDEGVISQLQDLLPGRKRAFLAWPFGTLADRRGVLPFFLELNGRLIERELFQGYWLNIYELNHPIFYPELKPALANFGDVQLTGIFIEENAEANSAICLALRWRLTRPVNKAYKAVITLWDEANHHISSTDVLLRNPSGLSTEHWVPGEEIVNFYVLPVPLGTPPGSYRLQVGLYDAGSLKNLDLLDEAGNPAGVVYTLGNVALTKAPQGDRDPYNTSGHLSLEPLENPEIADGLALEGFAVEHRPSARTVSVLLRWRALRDRLPQYQPRVRLRIGDQVLSETGSPLLETRYPTNMWSRGEVVLDWIDIVYPPVEGRAALEIEAQNRVTLLKEWEIQTSAVSFDVPPIPYPVQVQFGNFAELLGYQLDSLEVPSGEKVRLTLYWRAIEPSPVEYVVFTHLLNDEGQLIGQHDGPPANGTKPTTGWVQGEIITDVHEMEFREEGYQGKAFIEVGLYNPYTMERVTTRDGKDHLILPTQVSVVRN